MATLNMEGSYILSTDVINENYRKGQCSIFIYTSVHSMSYKLFVREFIGSRKKLIIIS